MPGLIPFLLVLFLIAAFLRVDFFFSILYLLVAVHFMARLWSRHTTDRLHAERRFTNRAFCGETVTAEVVVHNGSRLPIPWLKVGESLPVQLGSPALHREVISLGPKGRHRFSYKLYCRRRGYYAIGPLRMQSGDLLGLVRDRQVEQKAEPIIVYPRVVPLQQLGLPTHSPLVALPARSPLFEDPSRIMGVRDYRRGDSPRRIHWPATASAGRLLVKQYQPSIARETLVCLDFSEGGYASRRRYVATELAIVVAASLATHIVVRDGLAVGLTTEAWDPLRDERVRFFLLPRSERAHLMGVLEVLARVKTAPATPFTDLLRQESVKLAWGATLVIVTGSESEALFDTLVYLRRAGFAVALVLVRPEHVSVEMKKRSELLGVPVHRVWSERDLETWS